MKALNVTLRKMHAAQRNENYQTGSSILETHYEMRREYPEMKGVTERLRKALFRYVPSEE
jgi:hypothetical protein